MADRRVLAVTGASGFVGSHVARHFLAAGWEVRGLAREPARLPPGVVAFQSTLPDRLDARAFDGADVVVHAAYASQSSSLDEARRVDEEGTARVLAAARAAGVDRFVFVSSMAAQEEARSYYGRSKLALERSLDFGRDLAVRPGLVLGPGGLFARIARSLRRSRLAPAVNGGRQIVQTIHVEDLCLGLERALERERTGRITLAEPDGLPMRELFRLIGEALGVRCLVVPLPAGPLLWALKGCEAVGLRLPVTSENVLGALVLRPRPTAADLASLGLTVRTAAQSLADIGGRWDFAHAAPFF